MLDKQKELLKYNFSGDVVQALLFDFQIKIAQYVSTILQDLEEIPICNYYENELLLQDNKLNYYRISFVDEECRVDFINNSIRYTIDSAISIYLNDEELGSFEKFNLDFKDLENKLIENDFMPENFKLLQFKFKLKIKGVLEYSTLGLSYII